MGTKTFNNYEDLLTFTRASKGHALRPVSYGDELVTNGTFDSDVSGWTANTQGTSTYQSGELRATNTSGTAPVEVYQAVTLEAGKTYVISANITDINGVNAQLYLSSATSYAFPSSIVTGSSTLSEGPASFSFEITSSGTYYVILGHRGDNSAGNYAQYDNISLKEVTFDQPDGTLTLFEHPVNVPRVEWDSAGNRLGLLVEESRTNLVTYSEDFTNSLWVGNNASVFLQFLASPAGTQDVGVLSDNTANGEHFIAPTFSYTSGTAYTWSAFVKKNTLSYFWVRWSSGPFNAEKIVYNLEDGTIESSTADGSGIEDVGNGWYRVWSYNTADSTGGGGTAFGVSATAGTQSYAGSGNSVYIYGAQLEAGSFPTSYIKTTGATATRSADVASIPVADFGFNADAGSLLVEFNSGGSDGGDYPHAFSLDGSTTNDAIRVGFNTANLKQFVVRKTGTNQCVLNNGTYSPSDQLKMSVAYKENDFASSDNGDSVVTDTSGTLPTVSTLSIGKWQSGNYANGHIKSIQYYPRRLTDAQLQALTEPRSTPTLSLTFDGLESSYTENYIHG